MSPQPPPERPLPDLAQTIEALERGSTNRTADPVMRDAARLLRAMAEDFAHWTSMIDRHQTTDMHRLTEDRRRWRLP